jgi:pimeloyl-ACP methyl ester carboxylesterase
MRSPHVPFREHRVPVAPGRTLGAAELGDPNGFPVLWFHGTPGGRLQLPPDAPDAASARGLRLFGVERPGTGWSTPHRYGSVREFATDIRALADSLGLKQLAIAGLSGGGPYTLACAHGMPDRVVAAAVIGGIGPVSGPDAVPSYTRALALAHPMLAAIAEPVGRVLPSLLRPVVPHAELAIRAFAKVAPKADRPILLDPAFGNVLVGDILHVMPNGLAAPLHDARLFARDWGFRLRDVRVPVHFFQGDADGIVPESHGRHQARAVQRGELTILRGGGHLAGYVDAGRVFDVLMPFIPKRSARPSAYPAARPSGD